MKSIVETGRLAWIVLIVTIVTAVFLSMNLTTVNNAVELGRGNRELLCASLGARLDVDTIPNRVALQKAYQRRCK